MRYSVSDMQKKLGQYFLRSHTVLRTVVDSLRIPKETVIVEIGPGKGALTDYILKKYLFVVAVEKDDALVAALRNRFADALSAGALSLVAGDARDGAWRAMLDERSYAVIANIPYYLTGSLIKDLLTNSHPPIAMALVVQKEVGERITKRNDGKESLLSLSVQLFGTASYGMTVPRGAFSPQPKVDSAIITVTAIQQPNSRVQDAFFTIIKTAFQEKRKTVLKKFTGNQELQHFLAQNGVSPTDRAEDVPFAVWLAAAQSGI